jgi:hypothetical protein
MNPRPFVLASIFLISENALAAKIVCDNNTGTDAYFRAIAFTEDEEAAIKNNGPLPNEFMKEVFLDNTKNAPPPKREGAIEIPWSDAKRMVLRGYITQTMQYHNRSVYLQSKSGAIYKTTEPELDSISSIIQVVDPCRVFIAEATE